MEEDPFNNVDRDGLLDEITRLTEVNRQLQSELSILKDQYNEALNFTDKIEECTNENKILKKNLSDSRIAIDDLKRRLQISQQSNLELSQHQEKIKENADKQYNEELADLKLQLSIAKSENVNMNTRFQEQIKNYENSFYTSQSESALINNQMAKVLASVGNYFNQKFESPQDLIQKVNAAAQQLQKQNSELKKANLEISQLSDVQAKLISLKDSYQNEKNKKKELQTVVIKMKKKIDQMNFAHEEQITQLNDVLTQKTNEIERLELLNQQQAIENQAKKVKMHSMGCQVNSLDNSENTMIIDSHKRQISNLNTQIESLENNATMLKMQIDTLLTQLNDSDSQKSALNARLKQNQAKMDELEKELKQTKSENQNQTIKLNELQDKLNQNVSNAKIPIQQCESKIKILEKSLENKTNSIENLESLFLKQKSEISELTQIKEQLLNAIEKQNHMLNMYNDIINDNQKEAQNQEQKSAYVEKVIPTIPQFKWPIDKLPKEICEIVTDITENDSLSIESRIKNVFIIINRWIEQKEEKTQNELNDLTQKLEINSQAYKLFKDSLFELVKDGISDENEFNQNWKSQYDELTPEKEEQFINQYFSAVIKENNNSQSEIKEINDEIAYLFSSADVHDFPSLIEKHEKIMKGNKLLIEKLDEMKQKNQELKKKVKFVLTEREKENSKQISILQKSNENSRSQIDQLLASINKFKEQNELLLKQMKEKEGKIEQLTTENDKHRHRMLNDGQGTMGTTELNANLSEVQWKCDVLQNDLKNAEKSCNMWKETAQKVNDEKIQMQNRIDKTVEEFQNQIVQLNKKHEIENENNQNTILELSNKMKNQAEDSKIAIDKLNKSLLETHKLLDDALHEIANMKDEQENLKHSTAIQIEAAERSKRLSEAQLKAKILSIDANYSALLDEEKSNAEKLKKQLIEYFIGSFRNFFYSKQKFNSSYSINQFDDKLDEETFRDYVRKVKEEFEKHQRTENAIRKMIKANDNDSVEDALTQFIIQNRPLF